MNTDYTSYDTEDILKELKKKIPKKRFIHSISVAYTATALAMVHDVDIKSAYIAGLLHDYAKAIDYLEQLEFCKKHSIPLTDYEKNNPAIIHGKVGAFMVMKNFNLCDENIINSIINHTTGRKYMSKLEKIIFIADYIEPERDAIPNIEKIRKIAFVNLDEAMYIILKNITDYLISKGHTLDDETLDITNFYKKEAKIEQN